MFRLFVGRIPVDELIKAEQARPKSCPFQEIRILLFYDRRALGGEFSFLCAARTRKAEKYPAGSGGAALTLPRESCNLLWIYRYLILTLVKASSPCARACTRQTAQKEKPYALYYFAGI